MYLLNIKPGWNPVSFATTTSTTLKDGVSTRNRSSWTPCMYTTSGLPASSLGDCLINPYLACAWLGVLLLYISSKAYKATATFSELWQSMV